MEMQGTQNEAQIKKNFFISATPADSVWGTWVNWHLTEEGYSTIYNQDFLPGSNTVYELHRAISNAECIIAIFSRQYMNTLYTHPEWASAFNPNASQGAIRFIPIRVQTYEIDSFLKNIMPIDLVGLDFETAHTKLLEGVRGEKKRTKTPPRFPGQAPLIVGPYPERNPIFVGREKTLKTVYDSLNSGAIVAITHSLTTDNKESIGKTEIAREYLYRYQSNYSTILWVQDKPGISSSTFLSDNITAIVHKLGLSLTDPNNTSEAIAALKNWLSTHSDWLLVLDAVENIQITKDLLPAQRKGDVLITTRERSIASIAQIVEIEALSEEENELSQKLATLFKAAFHSRDGQHFHIPLGRTTIGRASDNTIVWDDPSISAHHAVIELKDESYQIIDLNSEQGTFVNHQQITPDIPYPLKERDSIRIGTVWFAYGSDTTTLSFPDVSQRSTTAGTSLPTQPQAPTTKQEVPSGSRTEVDNSLPPLLDPRAVVSEVQQGKIQATWQVFHSRPVIEQELPFIEPLMSIRNIAIILLIMSSVVYGTLRLSGGEETSLLISFSAILFFLFLSSLYIGVTELTKRRRVNILQESPLAPHALLILTPEGFVEFIDNDAEIDYVYFPDLTSVILPPDNDSSQLELSYANGQKVRWSPRAYFGLPNDIAHDIIKSFIKYLELRNQAIL